MNINTPSYSSSMQPRILIVDDEYFVCDIISRWLTAEGFICKTANRVKDAYELLGNDEFDLLVSDITMPGKTGLDLLEMTRRDFPHLAVVFVTAVDDRRTAIRSLEMGAYGYVIKPLDHNEVVINVINALERRRLVMESRLYNRRLIEEVRARTADLRRREEEIALRLVAASEYRDSETGAHIRRIGLYSAALARKLGWTAHDVDDLRIAATMHDIGKIGVPDNILLKPGRLTHDEFELMKTHTIIGARMLEGSDVPLLDMARTIALSHHEKWNGMGYPNGTAGRDIPESARIVAVSDVYDALVSKRVYKPAMSSDEAVKIMSEANQIQFDPTIFECFLDSIDEFKHIRETITEDAPVQSMDLDQLSRIPQKICVH